MEIWKSIGQYATAGQSQKQRANCVWENFLVGKITMRQKQENPERAPFIKANLGS